jgi:hypothetical protein
MDITLIVKMKRLQSGEAVQNSWLITISIGESCYAQVQHVRQNYTQVHSEKKNVRPKCEEY